MRTAGELLENLANGRSGTYLRVLHPLVDPLLRGFDLRVRHVVPLLAGRCCYERARGQVQYPYPCGVAPTVAAAV